MQAKYLRMVHALNIVNSGLNVPTWLSGLDAYRNSELLQQDLATERQMSHFSSLWSFTDSKHPPWHEVDSIL